MTLPRSIINTVPPAWSWLVSKRNTCNFFAICKSLGVLFLKSRKKLPCKPQSCQPGLLTCARNYCPTQTSLSEKSGDRKGASTVSWDHQVLRTKWDTHFFKQNHSYMQPHFAYHVLLKTEKWWTRPLYGVTKITVLLFYYFTSNTTHLHSSFPWGLFTCSGVVAYYEVHELAMMFPIHSPPPISPHQNFKNHKKQTVNIIIITLCIFSLITTLKYYISFKDQANCMLGSWHKFQ